MFHPPSRAGTMLAGKYQLETRIGIGGVSETYRAKNVALNRLVAIRMLMPDCALNPEIRERFTREAQTATLVRHRNVIDIVDIETDAVGVPFIVQEYLHGHSLADQLEQRGGRLEPRDAIEILIPIADALARVHERQLVHRDLKTANIFLSLEESGCVPKLVDFGSDVAAKRGAHRSTALGAEAGTPAYMSPEQVRDPATVGPTTDVWSFGVMLYEVLSGALPFEGENGRALAIAIATGEPRPITELVPTLAPELARFIHTCLRKAPAERFRNAREVHTALVNIAQGKAAASARQLVSAIAKTEIGHAVAPAAAQAAAPQMRLATGTDPLASTPGPAIINTLVDGSRGAVARSTHVGGVASPFEPSSGTLLLGGALGVPDLGGLRTTHQGVGPAIVDEGVTAAYDLRTAQALGIEPTIRGVGDKGEIGGTMRMEIPSSGMRAHEPMSLPESATPGKAPPELELEIKRPSASQKKAAPAPSSAKMKAAAPVGPPSTSGRKAPPAPTPMDPDDDDGDFGGGFQLGYEASMEMTNNANAPKSSRGVLPDGPSGAFKLPPGLPVPVQAGLGRANPHLAGRAPRRESRLVPFIGPMIHILAWLGVVAALMRFVYSPSGYDAIRLLPAAFDGTSLITSGGMSLGVLAICIAFGIGAFRGEKRTYGFLVSALGAALIGMAMITITFSSSGENAAPPDGALLIPFFLPLLTVGLSIGTMEWAFWQWRSGETSRRVLSVACAISSGAIAFLTVELSPLAKILAG